MTDLSRHSMLSVKADPVALLVDGENMSSDFAAAILSVAMGYGIPTVRRVYGKSAQIAGWAEHGFKLVPTRAGKNSADLLLSVEAAILALREQFHTLIVASSDSDYAYLAENLRELGHAVIGVGETKTAPAYRAACSGFVELVRPTEQADANPVVTARPAKRIASNETMPATAETTGNYTKKTLVAQIREEILIHSPQTGLVLTELNHLMRRKYQTKISETAEGDWRKYLMARPNIFICDPKGPNARVRLKHP